MALWLQTLAFLLALPSFLCVQDPALSSPSRQNGDRSPGFCTVAGNLPPSVSTTSIQTEFPIGQRVWVTCRPEQFEAGSFPVQCVDRAGHPEWDISHVNCIGKPESRQAGTMPWYVATAVAVGLLLSAGALVMWVVLSRRHQAARCSTEQEYYEELQPQGPLDSYSQMQSPLPAVPAVPAVPGVARRGIPDSSLQA